MGWVLIGFLILSIFLLGGCTAVYLLVRLLIRLFEPPSKPARPLSTPPALSREAELALMARETTRAFSAGKLGTGARDEMLAYIDAEKAEVIRKREAVGAAAPRPDRPAPIVNPGASAAPPPPPPPPPPPSPPPLPVQRDPVAVRAAIARLHEHAQQPVPVVAMQPKTVSPQDEAPRAEAVPAERPAVAPEKHMPAAGIVERPAAPVVQEPKKSIAERLFTPENVRILQSLGIGLIFFSAVAYVRTQMWDGSSVWTRMALLLGGTGACLGLGFALRRWTGLRITGLGFLILGHLSMVLDAVAALAPPGVGAHPLYPYHPGSLWTVTLAIFTASALWHARVLKEPLFDAFTFFGALAAWGAGAQWLDFDLWHMAAAYVPMVLACRFLYPLLSERGTPLQRWSLTWWMCAAWELGAPLLVFSELGIVLWAGRESVRPELWIHLAALAKLGLVMMWDARVSTRKQMAHFGSLALLSIWPFAAFSYDGPWWEYPMTVALPGAGLALAVLLWSKWRSPADDEADEIAAGWSITALGLAAAVAVVARLLEPAAVASAAWSAASLASVGLALVVFRASVTGAWLATIGSAMLSAMVLDLTGIGLHWMPVLWLAFAHVAALCAWRKAAHPLASTVRDQADILALGALLGGAYFWVTAPHAVWTFVSTAEGMYGPAPLYQFLTALALTLFALATSFTLPSSRRRLAGVLLLGPTTLYGLSTFGVQLATPAIWMTALAALAWLAVEGWAKREREREQVVAGWAGVGFLMLLATVLSLLDLVRPAYALAAWDFLVLGGVVTAAAIRCRRIRLGNESCVALETLSLGLLSGAALCFAATQALTPIGWVSIFPLLASLALLLALAGEKLKGQADPARPFRTAGEALALLLSVAGLARFLFEPEVLMRCPLHLVWMAALPMLFLAVRDRLSSNDSQLTRDEPSPKSILATGHLLITIFICTGLSLYRDFWAVGIPGAVRAECAVFFAVLLALSALTGVWLRSALAPALAGCAALALSACAYGHWRVSYETFGLPAMLIAVALMGVGGWLEQNRKDTRGGQSVTSNVAGGLLALLTGTYLLYVLSFGPKGGLQAASVSAWLLAAAALWHSGRRVAPGLSGFACGLGLLLAGLHGLRWGAVEFTAFGPAIGAFALAMLAAREVAEFLDVPADVKPLALRGRAGGLLVVACGAMLLAGAFAMAGHLDDRPWHWIGTLCEGAFFLGALTVLSRRRARETPGGMWLLAELGMWLALLMALGFSLTTLKCGDVLQGVTWAGVGAMVLLIGMIFESIAGALIGPSAQARVPGAFLESRHIVAAGCAALALVTALAAPESEQAWMVGLWQACFGAALLAIYGSLSRPSVSASATQMVRYASALCAYAILLPLGYLAFLKAHSTGDSWGAVWFLALAPVLLGVAWLLKQEHEEEQAGLAKIGALLVSGGAAVLAFAANHGRLAEVPAWTFFGLAIESLLMRRWQHRKEWTVAVLVALSGAAFYALRALHGDPAWGMAEAWVWEGTYMAGMGLAMAVGGGCLRLEPDDDGRSVVGLCGGTLTLASLGLMLVSLLEHGPAAAYLGTENTARLDAFNIALILGAATAAAAWHWMRFGLGKWLAPAQLLAAYALTIWAWHVVAWEYYTVPAALMCFFWAWQSDRASKGTVDAATRVWQILGSVLLLAPSLVQAVPHTDPSVVHFFCLVALSLLLVGGAMWTRRKIPLLSASSALLLCTIIKTAQWAADRQVILPVAGIGLGFAVLAVGCLFESRMNRALRTAADQVRAQARMFWMNWE